MEGFGLGAGKVKMLLLRYYYKVSDAFNLMRKKKLKKLRFIGKTHDAVAKSQYSKIF